MAVRRPQNELASIANQSWMGTSGRHVRERTTVFKSCLINLGAMWITCLLTSVAIAEDGYFGTAAHSQGNIQITMTAGRYGRPEVNNSQYSPYVDPITHDSVYGCIYPRGSRSLFGWSDLFLVGVVDMTFSVPVNSSGPTLLFLMAVGARNRLI